MGTGRQALPPVELGQKHPADPLFGDSAICSFPFACVCDSSFPTSFGVKRSASVVCYQAAQVWISALLFISFVTLDGFHSLPTLIYSNGRNNRICCFKPLCFRVVCCTITNLNTLSTMPLKRHLSSFASIFIRA